VPDTFPAEWVARRLVVRTAASLALPAEFELSPLQTLQHALLAIVSRAHEADEQTARAFTEFLIEVAAREARGR
jgi:hypothetical protein